MPDLTAMAHPPLARIVDAIRDNISPELILLFGSRAGGDARNDSDYDLLVVVSDASDPECKRVEACNALHAIGIGADVLVRSVTDYERRQQDPGFLDWLVARKGVLLYSSGLLPQRSADPLRVREQPREGLRAWIERAEEDFRIASMSLGAANPATGAVCFHAHACVEKLLKALIVKRGRHPSRTHSLPDLLSLQAPGVGNDSFTIRGCALLQRLYPGSRYPGEPMPTLEDARGAFEAARLMRDLLLPLVSAIQEPLDPGRGDLALL